VVTTCHNKITPKENLLGSTTALTTKKIAAKRHVENTHAQKQAPVEHHGQASNTRGGRLPNTHKNKCMQRKFVVAGNLIGPHVPSCVLIATTKASGKRQLASMCRAAGWQLENS
jgi:hypothetical protein